MSKGFRTGFIIQNLNIVAVVEKSYAYDLLSKEKFALTGYSTADHPNTLILGLPVSLERLSFATKELDVGSLQYFDPANHSRGIAFTCRQGMVARTLCIESEEIRNFYSPQKPQLPNTPTTPLDEGIHSCPTSPIRNATASPYTSPHAARF